MNNIPNKNPIREEKIPTYVEILSGITEKFVNTLNHTEIDFTIE